MHSDTRLDSPPPPSRFRRPWSPDPLDSFNYSRYNRRREPSDVSVEALDLADYAMTLPRRTNWPYDNRYDFMPNDPYPPSPRGFRPFTRSRDSLHPPSLASPGDTLSTATSASRSPRDRPWSPPPRSYNLHTSSQRSAPRIANHDHHLPDRPHSHQDHDPEIDIGRFPAFTRHWYSNHRPMAISPPSAYHSVSNADSISPFDPAYPTHKHNFLNSFQRQPFSDLGYHSVPSSLDSNSRNVLPWVNEARDPLDEQLDPEVKKERVQMLEREFFGAGKGTEKGLDDEEVMIGSADRRGRLITQGPKKRLATRWFQALLTLGAAFSLVYIALVIKPKEKPPPQGKIPIYVLYVLSILTFLLVTYLFLIFPFCCLGRAKDSRLTEPMGPEGMMVLPVQQLPGGSKQKGSKEKKKNKKGKHGGTGDVQVNLIVDPNIFGSRRGREEDGFDDGDHSSWLGTNSGRSSGSNGRGQRGPKRRSVFAGLALEAKWKKARRRLKWAMVVDAVCFVLWGAEFVIILVGQRCPAGGFDGWCDGYNFATALACLTCVLFGFSVFFDIKDLHGSRASPRTRT